MLCARDAPITLAIDFSSRPQWRYAASLSIKGLVQAGERRESYEGTLKGILVGERTDTSASSLRVRLDSAELTTTFLDEAAAAALRRQIAQAHAVLSVSRGDILLQDLSPAPVSVDWEWDVYRNLAKVLPAFPQGPVTPGAVWERERAVPLHTRHGEAIGHLYQTFALDSIARHEGSRVAFVSWIFSYKVELAKPDTAGLLDDLPGGGTGRGSACVDVTAGFLQRSDVRFEVSAPAQHTTPVAAWSETAHVELLPGRNAR